MNLSSNGFPWPNITFLSAFELATWQQIQLIQARFSPVVGSFRVLYRTQGTIWARWADIFTQVYKINLPFKARMWTCAPHATHRYTLCCPEGCCKIVSRGITKNSCLDIRKHDLLTLPVFGSKFRCEKMFILIKNFKLGRGLRIITWERWTLIEKRIENWYWKIFQPKAVTDISLRTDFVKTVE
jgi:hypothetical protein